MQWRSQGGGRWIPRSEPYIVRLPRPPQWPGRKKN